MALLPFYPVASMLPTMMNLEGKTVAVLGGGTSGFCAARLAKAKGATVTGYDSGPTEKLEKAIQRFADEGIELITGEAALAPQCRYDICVISPGIDASWPLAVALAEVSDELIGEIELAWRLSDIPVIAITGTNGKTTTTELTTHLLNACGKKAIAAGNYGYAYSDVVYYGEQWDWVVLEVSSFQLETIDTFHPQVALWMNFAPDHMDRYEALEDYRQAKLRIFTNHTEADTTIVKAEESDGIPAAGHRITFSAFSATSDYRYQDKQILSPGDTPPIDYSQTKLNGKHNAENVMAAVAAVTRAGVAPGPALTEAINSYRPPAHRCEVVGEKDGVLFVNDSKATNLHALESALRGQDAAVTLIVGGKNKGLDFSELNDLLPDTVSTAICIGEIRHEIAEIWQPIIPCHIADSLDDAVAAAFAKKGNTEVILFSPGTSSFDMFSGYEERGEYFIKLVAKFS